MQSHGEAIDADLQREYGLAVGDVIAGRVTWRRFKGLLAGMPSEGTAQWRHARRNPAPDRKPTPPPDEWWTAERDLMASMIERLDVLIWMRTKDAQDGKNAPKPIARPGVKVEAVAPTRVPTAEAVARLAAIGPSGGPSLDAGADEHGEADGPEHTEDGPGDGEAEPPLTPALSVAQAEQGQHEPDGRQEPEPPQQ